MTNTQSNDDKELEIDILQFVTTEHEKGEFGSPCSTRIRFDKEKVDAGIRKLIKKREAALLSRIQEDSLVRKQTWDFADYKDENRRIDLANGYNRCLSDFNFKLDTIKAEIEKETDHETPQ